MHNPFSTLTSLLSECDDLVWQSHAPFSSLIAHIQLVIAARSLWVLVQTRLEASTQMNICRMLCQRKWKTEWRNVYAMSAFATADALQFTFFTWSFYHFVQQVRTYFVKRILGKTEDGGTPKRK